MAQAETGAVWQLLSHRCATVLLRTYPVEPRRHRVNDPVQIAVTTQIFGLGGGRPALPTLVELHERTVSARTLIAEHVRGELGRVAQRRTSSLALHYLLSDDVRSEPGALAAAPDVDREVRRAWRGLAEKRYVLVVDGTAVDELDATVALTEQSRISFVRLLPLVGG